MKKLFAIIVLFLLAGFPAISACSPELPGTNTVITQSQSSITNSNEDFQSSIVITSSPVTTGVIQTRTTSVTTVQPNQITETPVIVPQPSATSYITKTITTLATTTNTVRPAVTTPVATATGVPRATSTATTIATTTAASGNIGLSSGGAKDIVNFRENINNNYLPQPTDITYEGLFYDYFFDTGQNQPSTKLFSPSYSFAVTRDPISLQTEYYLSVGLNSGLKESDFQRKKLNLVIVIDKSGSMSSDYNRYYYDRIGNKIDIFAEEGGGTLQKIESVKRAVISILDQLSAGDRFAIVTFDSNATLFKAMGPVGSTNMNNIEDNVWNILAGGSTNLDAGIDLATQQFHGLYEIDNYEYENRIIILTDAQPNTGDISSYGLTNTLSNNANNRIYTTFVGIGVDFNTNLIEQISKTKGANYYAVHSPREFRERIDDEFDYMVTPLVFNVRMNFESSGWKIDKVFGSPQADQSTGELMRIDTLFPSKNEGGETKGGIILLKLRKISTQSKDIYLKVTYQDRNGRTDSSQAMVSPDTQQPEYFENTGIRKGILLVRYASLLKNWMADERSHLHFSSPWNPCIDEKTGITIPVETSQWERTSLPLVCSHEYHNLIQKFFVYFTGEMDSIGDYSLDQEITVMNIILTL
jgi:Ca-activated chloride channel homolog